MALVQIRFSRLIHSADRLATGNAGRAAADAAIHGGRRLPVGEQGGGVSDPLTTRDVPRIRKRVAELAGLVANGVSGNSGCVGMAPDLTVERAELPAMQTANGS